MSECAAGYCGVNRPATLPGDPDNNIGITAVGAYGGIDVTWSVPGTNDHAIAYTMVYRSPHNLFEMAVLRSRVGGTFYFDALDDDVTLYYYWVRNVTVNGTVMPPVGPASARAKPPIEKLLQQLTGKIDAGLLAQELKGDVERIYDLQNEIIAERTNRISANGIIENAISGLQIDVSGLDTAIQNETMQRVDDNEAIAAAMNVLYAAKEANNALILEEKVTRATADSALSLHIETVQAQSESNSAAITASAEAYADDKEALATQLNTMVATAFKVYRSDTMPVETSELTFNDNDLWVDTSAISEDDDTPKNKQYFWNGTAWEASEDSGIRGAMAAINTEATARATALGAMTEAVEDHVSSINDEIASVSTTVGTAVGDIDDLKDYVGSKYSIVLKAGKKLNGSDDGILIGGFGLYNSGETVQAGFDVDEFWIGRTDGAGIKPFIIQNNTVYMNGAVINSLTIDKLRTASGGVIVENNKIKAEFLEVQQIDLSDYQTKTGTFSGTLNTSSSATGDRMVITNQAIKVYSGGVLRVQMGNLSA